MPNDGDQGRGNLLSLMQRKKKTQEPQQESEMSAPAHVQPEPRDTAVPQFKRRQKKEEFERHTFYATPRQIKEVKYYALIDDRAQSEILREALENWFEQRRRQGD